MNVVHFCVVVVIRLSGVMVVFLGVIWVDREVIVMHDVTDSVFFSLVFVLLQLYVFSLLYRNLMAAYLFWVGWLEE